jgi:hypothetical protein
MATNKANLSSSVIIAKQFSNKDTNTAFLYAGASRGRANFPPLQLVVTSRN